MPIMRGDSGAIYKHACALGCEGIVSKRLGSPYGVGRSDHWIKIKNPAAPAVCELPLTSYPRRRAAHAINIAKLPELLANERKSPADARGAKVGIDT
jgi:hypothetical protein